MPVIAALLATGLGIRKSWFGPDWQGVVAVAAELQHHLQVSSTIVEMIRIAQDVAESTGNLDGHLL